MSDIKEKAIGWVIFLAILTISWSWNTQWMYDVRYSELPSSDIVVESRPSTCDFFGAPMGSKDCSMEKVVTEGHDEHGKLNSVFVGWTKKQD
jgi:hypothetical protein